MTTSKQFQRIKNSDQYDYEKQRINNYIKNRYANDEEFREKVKEQARQRRIANKLLKLSLESSPSVKTI